jgi:signal transduction histidine kinase
VDAPARLCRPGFCSPLFDALVAGVFTVAVLAITAHIPPADAGEVGSHAVDGLGYSVVVLSGAALALRRRWPLPVFGVVTALLALYAARNYAGGPVYAAFGIALYSVAISTDRRRALLLGAAGVVALFVPHITLARRGAGWVPLLFLSWVAGIVFFGDAARNRRAYFAALEQRAHDLEQSREEEARRQVAEERLRIARDVHDVVAHSIASINVQSSVAAHVMDQQPERAREALLAIKQASKEALTDLRAALGQLRQEDEDAPLAPAPALSQLDALVATAAQAGVPVEVSVRGEPHPLPPAVEATAFRIVQESLTNVVRHAGPARATVSMTYAASAVELEVVDDGKGANGAAGSTGHGLRGMQERAASVGGRLEAGPRPGAGGFRVWARLPGRTVDVGSP